MNCCRANRNFSERTGGKYEELFREILVQIPNATYAAIYDRSANSLVADFYFCERRDERSGDQGSHMKYNIEPLMSLLKRTRDIGSLAGESADPSTMLLTTSMGYVFCVLSVAYLHSLIIATLFDPSDATEMSTIIFEMRLRGVVAKLGSALASQGSITLPN